MATVRAVRTSRNPFQLWVLIACVLTGVLGVLPLRPRGVIDEVLSPTLALGWYVGLLVAGGTCVVGAFLPVSSEPLKRATIRLDVERVGMHLLAGLLVGYGVAIELLAPTAPTGGLLLGLAVAAAVRVRQIKRELHALHALHALARHIESEESS